MSQRCPPLRGRRQHDLAVRAQLRRRAEQLLWDNRDALEEERAVLREEVLGPQPREQRPRRAPGCFPEERGPRERGPGGEGVQPSELGVPPALLGVPPTVVRGGPWLLLERSLWVTLAAERSERSSKRYLRFSVTRSACRARRARRTPTFFLAPS